VQFQQAWIWQSPAWQLSSFLHHSPAIPRIHSEIATPRTFLLMDEGFLPDYP